MLAALPLAIVVDDVIGALEVVDEDVVEPDPLELHAASPALSASAATAAGTRRRFIRIPDMGISFLSDVSSVADYTGHSTRPAEPDWSENSHHSFVPTGNPAGPRLRRRGGSMILSGLHPRLRG
jgi:hypothetical protein